VFELSDPQIPMVEPRRKKYFKNGPRISIVMPPDPVIPFFAAKPFPPLPPEHKDANAHLVQRLAAIKSALDDLPRQARRLVRWTARRKAIAAKRLIYTSPLRPGRAPYLPKEPVREIDFILERCHLLARDALRADTS
jgi:hypothetical protein